MDLKPCPFCGNIENLQMCKTFEYFTHKWYVNCKSCGMCGPCSYIGGEFGKNRNDEGERAAIESWNRRYNGG